MPVKIGFVAELSGPQGALGQDQWDAFMLVVERFFTAETLALCPLASRSS